MGRRALLAGRALLEVRIGWGARWLDGRARTPSFDLVEWARRRAPLEARPHLYCGLKLDFHAQFFQIPIFFLVYLKHSQTH